MKAVFVFDADKDEFGEAVAMITTEGYTTSFARGVVRPLPEMKDADDETDMSGGDDYASGYRDGWDRGIEIGWNRYRKTITGEKE